MNLTPDGQNKSGSITLGGTAQTLAADNPGRHGLWLQNISAEDMWLNCSGGVAAANTAGSFKIASFGLMNIPTNDAVSIVAATTGSKFTAVEY